MADRDGSSSWVASARRASAAAPAEIRPRPGDGCRAIGVSPGLLEPGAFSFSSGMLPLDATPEGSASPPLGHPSR